jgi:3-dehydrotetronate 4-kinase
MRFGAIADDATGGTDLASVLRRAGVDVIQVFEAPSGDLPDADAVVVSLKTRTAPTAAATASARSAAQALRDQGAEQIYFKYCSTFDSTDEGNIGPVLETLLDQTGTPLTVACPAYPALGRTVYAGHLFVGHQLLSESPMRHHPLTPMTDSNLVRVLGRQSRLSVGLLPLDVVDEGTRAIRSALNRLTDTGVRLVIVDAITDRHIRLLADATADLLVASGGAALGGALGRSRGSGALPVTSRPGVTPGTGPVAILSGSCSTATLAQVRYLGDRLPVFAIDALRLAGDDDALSRIVDWCHREARAGHDLFVTSTETPEALEAARNAVGRAEGATLVESAFRAAATALAEAGVRTFVVAGGETSGAVMQALGVKALRFGAEIEPGVPWTDSIDPPGFRLALKSGNFGSPEFFVRALGEARGRI